MPLTRPRAGQINFDLTNITDPLIRINSGQTGSADKDVGIVIERGDDTNVAIIYDESADQFVLVNTTEDGTTSGNVTISSYADLQVATINTATLEIGGTAVTSTAAELNILDGVTATTAELNILDGVTATAAELNYVDGVTSNIQTQIDNISSSFTLAADSGSNDTFTTGQTLTIAGGTGIDTTVSDNNISIAIDSTVATLTGSQTLTNKTLTTPVISSISNTGTLTLPTSTDTLVGRATTDTLTNKTLTSPTITGTGAIAGTFTGNITGDVTGNADTATALATARNIAGQSFDGTGNISIASTDLSDTASIVLTTASQTLTNKTLTAPVISSISNTGTLTLPTSTGTVALTSDISLSTLSVTASALEINILDGVTATTSELNIIDGDTSATSTTLADADRVVVNDAGTMKQVALTDFETYFETALDTLSNVTSVGTLNGLTIASTQTISMGANRVTSVADPVGNQDAATKAYVDANAGGEGGASGFTQSTTTTAPGSDGDFDLSFNVAQDTQETPFEAGGSDAFGVSLGEVYDQMEPVGSTSVVDLGAFT
jgi:hypothetical protein